MFAPTHVAAFFGALPFEIPRAIADVEHSTCAMFAMYVAAALQEHILSN
jgi:hypothetical protein